LNFITGFFGLGNVAETLIVFSQGGFTGDLGRFGFFG